MKDKSVPEVAKISALITALKLYIGMHAGSCRNPQSAYVFDTPSLASWDALDWYEVIQDIELIDFLISGTKEADRLLASLQSCIHWQMLPEFDHIRKHSRISN
jgi:hypothetical protein